MMNPIVSRSIAAKHPRAGYSLLEVQVAFVVLGVALSGICPLIVMQLRMTKKIEAQFDANSIHHLVPSSGSYAYDASGKVIGFASGGSPTDRWARKLGATAALRSSSSLSGFVYLDLNNDGVKQALEPGIAGATLTLTFNDAHGTPVSLVALTASNGAYLFANLAPGNYTIAETQPAGYADGEDTIGSQGGDVGSDMLSNLVLGAKVDGTGNNFGEANASLAGSVYVDLNEDGVRQDTEPGIANALVSLTGTDSQGGSVALSLRTNSVGAYLFSPLRAGTYSIAETTPSGYADGPDSLGTRGGTVGDDQMSSIALGAGDQGANYNFGEHVTDSSLGSLSGSVYVDQNGNGAKDTSEPGIAGVALTLSGTDDRGASVQLATTTDIAGGYQFTNLLPGTYSIAETTPNGYTDGQDTVGTQGGTAGDDLLVNLPLGAGVNGAGNNFGEHGSGSSGALTPAILSGYVFVDTNGNGARDEGEPGVSGVTVTLSGTSSAVTTTAPTGFYSFTGLTSGTYTVAETQPSE
jgi:hypothetical protein